MHRGVAEYGGNIDWLDNMILGVTAAWQTMVSGNYQFFGLHDPTCEESDNFATALSDASGRDVGWALNALMVNVVYDLVYIRVRVEVYEQGLLGDESADLIREGRLELPGGLVSIPQSLEEEWQRGVTLPTGAGTYDVRVLGYGRKRARAIWDRQMASAVDQPDIPDALAGVESYRICLRRISPEPRWPDEDDDDE